MVRSPPCCQDFLPEIFFRQEAPIEARNYKFISYDQTPGLYESPQILISEHFRSADKQIVESRFSVAFVIPCCNEALTIAEVVKDCRRFFPEARVYVFDNNSTDDTAAKARAAGAQIIASVRQGKGEVIQHAFSIVNEDAIVILDGDGTYSVEVAQEMIQGLRDERYDMIVCNRISPTDQAYPKFHRFGNVAFSWFVGLLLGTKVTDVFSGYRAVSREFYRSIDLESRGFEIESEMTLKAFSHGFNVKEVQGHYRERPEGSYSKLKTFRDGFKILGFIFSVIRDCRPLLCFGWVAATCFLLSLWAGFAPVMDFIREHYVHTVPRAVLAAGLMILSTVFFVAGLILDVQVRNLRAQSKLMRRWLFKDSRSLEPRRDSSAEAA